MAYYLSLLVIALAVSLDGCSVGLLYGARRIRIPFLSLVIISACSGLIIWCSMKAGALLARSFEPDSAKAVGAVILIMIGVWAIVQFFVHSRKQEAEEISANAAQSPMQTHTVPSPVPVTTILRIELRKIGLVIQILRSPSVADIDKSGNISSWEASLLGIALSFDALGAGIGAAMVGYPALSTAILISIVSGLFIFTGLRLGRWAANVRWFRKMTVLPGLLLIAMGIIKMF